MDYVNCSQQLNYTFRSFLHSAVSCTGQTSSMAFNSLHGLAIFIISSACISFYFWKHQATCRSLHISHHFMTLLILFLLLGPFFAPAIFNWPTCEIPTREVELWQ